MNKKILTLGISVFMILQLSVSVEQVKADDPTPDIPISYGQIYSNNGGNLTYVLDKIAGRELLANKELLKKKGIEIKEV